MKKYIIFILMLLLSFSFINCISNNDLLKIHYIDIGQGDSTLIEYNSKVLLIDSGPNSSEEKLSKYLKKHNIKTIDYLIATHPHEDHIGNMDFLIKNFKVNQFLMPKALYKSNDFKDLIKSLKQKNLDINVISSTTKNIIDLGNSIKIEFFTPNTTYENLNNYSPIMKLTYKKTSFLFTGDAEKEVENEVLNKDIDSDVLKVGHHGSSSSSTHAFLEKVTPKISIISCGINNNFKHPHKTTLNNLENIGSKIYRTDEDGTIILTSDGNIINKK